MDKNLDLNKSANLPQSAESYESASGPGTARGDLKRGYAKLESSHDEYPMCGPYAGEDCDGTTYEGEYAALGGFLNRPTGYER